MDDDSTEFNKYKKLPPVRSGKAKIIKVFKNGQSASKTTSVLVNEKQLKNFDNLLECVTGKVTGTHPVRVLYTPETGTRVTSFDQLEDDSFYAYAYTDSEAFKPVRYDSNRIKRPFLVSTGSPRRIDSFKTDQIAPSKTFPDVKPRFHDTTQYNACRIHLAENGNIKKGCKPFTFSPSKESLENIIGRICKEKNTNCNHLIDCDTEQTVIDIKDLKHGQKYVMVSKLPDFVPGDYSLGKEKDISAPRYVHHRVAGFLSQSFKTLQPIGHTTNASPHSSVASHPQTRKRETRQERNGGIQTRPVKHNHVSDKDGRGGAYSDRDNGVFKAKSQNQHTKGAKEVVDSKDTRVDLPIDQVTAEEVEQEEIVPVEETMVTVPSQVTLSRDPSDPSNENSADTYQKHISFDVDESQKNDDNFVVESEEERIRNEGNRTDRQPAKAKRGTNSKTVPNSKKATDTKKETTHKTNSKTNPTPKVADHSHHGGGGNLDTQKTKHSGTRGDFNNVSPLPPISKQNNEKRTSSPAPNDRRKSQAQKENEAATTIQANFKGYKTRQELQKQKTEMKANDASASKTDNKQDTKKKEEDNKKKVDDAKKKEDEEQNKAATKIQAGFRGHQTRKELAKQKEDVAKVNKQSDKPQNSKGSYNEEEMAATRIQANYRGYKTRKSINQKKNTKTQNNKEMDENAAATKIQANYRGHRARQDLKQKEKEEENKAATKIQANYRGHKARKDVKQQKEEAEAATKIQATFRGHKTRKELKNQTKQKVEAPAPKEQEQKNAQGKTTDPKAGDSKTQGQTEKSENKNTDPKVNDNKTPNKTEQPQGKTDQSQGKTEQPQGKTDQSQGKTEQPQGKTDQSQVKTEQPQGKSDQSQGKTEQPQGKTEQPQGKTEQPQGKTDQSQGKTEQPQGKTDQSQVKTEQPQGKTDQAQAKTEQSQGKNDQPQGKPVQQSKDDKPSQGISTNPSDGKPPPDKSDEQKKAV